MSRWMTVTLHLLDDGDPEKVKETLEENPSEHCLSRVETRGNDKVYVTCTHGTYRVSVTGLIDAVERHVESAVVVQANDTDYRGKAEYYEKTRRGFSRVDSAKDDDETLEGVQGRQALRKLDSDGKSGRCPPDGIPIAYDR